MALAIQTNKPRNVIEMIIRKEKDADSEEISQITIAAFKTLPISNHTEQFIIKALRIAGALTVSLVAEIDGRVAGHVLLTKYAEQKGENFLRIC